MSFVRSGRAQQHPKGKKTLRPKKTAPSRREWLSTVHDLSVHKLTPAELSHRHEIHKSHNKAVAQWELREKALQQRLRRAGSPTPLDQTSLNIIREVLSDQMLLQDVLARSDRAIAVVKDIFGDAPRRQTGHPSVTMAPNCASGSVFPVFQRPDPPTELSLLSQSMMDQQALNELETSDDCDENKPDCSVYNVIQRANIRKMKSKATGKVIGKQTVCPNSHQTGRAGVPVTPCAAARAPDQAALNATVAVQRARRSQNQTENNEEVVISQILNPEHLSHSGSINSSLRKTRKCAYQSSELDGSSFASFSRDQSSLGLLQSMLGQVEADIDSLSPDTIPTSDESPQPHRTKGLTGFSVALVSTLGRLVHLFKQNKDKDQRAALERRRFEEELKEQRRLIDALTAENLALKEESAVLQARLQQQISEIEQKVDTVVLVMGGFETPLISLQDPDISAAAVAERDDGQTQVSPAVLLSPPQQRDNWSHISVTPPASFDILRSSENIQTHGSLSNLISLPSTSSLSLTSMSSKLSPEVMLAEIAQLSRQNELIRAQLSQAKSLAAGGTGSPSSYIEERCMSCSSSGSPQSVVERRMSGSTCTEKSIEPERTMSGSTCTEKSIEPERTMSGSTCTEKSIEPERTMSGSTCTEKSSQPAESEQQQTETSSLNVSSVEQRLLELNRQSAAARSRLLEIIDQQKQNASAQLSSLGSPVPPSAFSPVTESRASSEVSFLQQEPILQNNREKRGACNELSPSQSLRSKASDSKAEEKQRAPEGWFSLSTHLR